MADNTTVGFYGNTGAGWGMVMDTTSGNVGIGTLTPTQGNLHVEGETAAPAVVWPLQQQQPRRVWQQQQRRWRGWCQSTSGTGVYGSSNTGDGVLGYSGSGSGSGSGVYSAPRALAYRNNRLVEE